MKRLFYSIVTLMVLGALATGGYFGALLLEGQGPEVRLIAPERFLGRKSIIIIEVHDRRSGIRNVAVTIKQGEKQADLEARSFPVETWWKGSGQKTARLSWTVDAKALGLKDGRAELMVYARDSSLRNEFKGNLTQFKKSISIDITPPRITLLSRVHNVRIGGAGLVTFKVNEPIKKVGVLVDDIFFKPFSREHKDSYSVLFAVPAISQKTGRSVFIVAEDLAGNLQKRGFFCNILPFRPKKDRIRITDGFLRRKMPEFTQLLDFSPDENDLLKVFLIVNNRMRDENNRELLSHCKDVTGPPRWKGGFKALSNAARKAGFADERRYYYKGKEIDQAYHMGLDLASIRNAPVPAANSGMVVFTGDIGIYGNTVIIDHGAGLYSVYSHLGSINVSEGDTVKKGDVIGQTDTTGLAGGDHLHFATVVQGVFVNPVEWLDPKWIRDHISRNL